MGRGNPSWLTRARLKVIGDLRTIRRISSGRVAKVRDPASGEIYLRAEEDLHLKLPALRGPGFRVAFEARLGSPDHSAALACGRAVLRIRGDHADEGVLKIFAVVDGREKSLSFRLRPDVALWGGNQNEYEAYRKELEANPGWSTSWIRLALDISPHAVRSWIQGRFIGEDTRRRSSTRVSVELSKGVVFRSILITPLSKPGFLPLDIAPYSNCRATAPGGLGEGYAFSTRVLRAQGMLTVHRVPFQVEWVPGRGDNIDLGETAYRGKLPYVHCDAMQGDPRRVLLRVPKAHYHRLHLICVADTADGDLPVASVRMIASGRGHAGMSEVIVPRWDERGAGLNPLPVGSMRKEGFRTRESARLWFVTVPLNPGEFLEFLNDGTDFLEIDLTRKVAADDESFPRPAGPPSSVHIFAATLELAPATVVVRWNGEAPVFEQPVEPKIEVALRSQRGGEQHLILRLEITGPYGGVSGFAQRVLLGPFGAISIVRTLPQQVYGKFDLRLSVEVAGERRFAEHATSFAFLPADKRRAARDSPFGMWCFFEVHNGLSPESAAPLMRIAGVRWTLPGFLLSKTDEENARRLAVLRSHKIDLNCGNVCCISNTCCEKPGDAEEMVRRMGRMPPLDAWMVFWETGLSSRHRGSFPPELLGRPALDLTEEEQRHLENCWISGTRYCRLVRERFPNVKLVFGNGFPAFIGAMMKRGYPKEYLDAFGLDFDLFRSNPERQVCPLYSPFSGIYVLKALQRFYGYEEFPLYLTEAIYAPVAPGWLTEREQADHYVRAHLLALASGVVFFGMCTSLYDPGDEYFYSHYGPIGLLHSPPQLNPRESFCAYSTMTRVLDQARFDRLVPTGSGSVYCLRFVRKAKGPVHALWTIRGTRSVTLGCSGATRPTATDMFGNRRRIRNGRTGLKIELTSSPIYLEGVEQVHDLVLGDPVHCTAGPEGSLLADFEDISDWRLDDDPLEELDALRLSVPYRQTRLDLSLVGRDGRNVLRVRLPENSPCHPLEISYARLAWRGAKATIPESAREIGCWVRGNSSWGRVLFCLEDAAGSALTSVRADSFLDFDGWRYLDVTLPHGPSGMEVERTGFEPWVIDSTDDPECPLVFKGLVLEARSHIIHAGQLNPVSQRFYDVDRIGLVGRTPTRSECSLSRT